MKPRHKKPKPKEVGMKGWSLLGAIKPAKSAAHNHNHENGHNHGGNPPEGVPIYTIAVILDGEVYEVLRAQEKLADIFLATPTFVLDEEQTGQARIGMEYKDGQFREKQ